MEFEHWVNGFKTIYESIWVGISENIKVFKESETSYLAESKTGQVYFLQKDDMEQIKTFLKDTSVELLFGIEKQTGKCTEIMMEFRSQTKDYRVFASYGVEGKELISLYAWGEKSFPNAVEIAKEVCNILLKRECICHKYQQGLLDFEYDGIVNKENCRTF